MSLLIAYSIYKIAAVSCAYFLLLKTISFLSLAFLVARPFNFSVFAHGDCFFVRGGYLGFLDMGNCLLTRNPFISRVSSNVKSESPKVKSLSLVQEQEEQEHRKLPSNPEEVEILLRDFAENPLIKLSSNPEEVENLHRDSATNPLIAFIFDELKEITGNFRQDNILGGGGFGIVYKGFIAEDFWKGLQSLQVAVKIHGGDNSFQGNREWLAEGQLSHPNLVKLIGYCCEDNHLVHI